MTQDRFTLDLLNQAVVKFRREFNEEPNLLILSPEFWEDMRCMTYSGAPPDLFPPYPTPEFTIWGFGVEIDETCPGLQLM